MTGRPELVNGGAEAIRLAFERYHRRFREVTRRAPRRFERREWIEGQLDAAERLELYGLALDSVTGALAPELLEGPEEARRRIWSKIKASYASAIEGLADIELAETFFNSVTRRVFSTAGVDPDVEFVDSDLSAPTTDTESTCRTYPRTGPFRDTVADLLADHALADRFASAERDAALAARRVEDAWAERHGSVRIEAIEVVDSVFYRGRAAYLVGRVTGGGHTIPIVLVLLNPGRGIEVDAVLLTESEVSVVFSYTRAYFHVDVAYPTEAIRFLSSIMPRKPLAELYNSLGYNKHGKTEMFRDLRAHMRAHPDRFDFAPGEVGMVMIVFAAESYEYVFKVIRDHFAYPKTNSREDVLRRYQLVFKHDRAGRLVEAQEFEYLEFERGQFAPALLAELQEKAARTVTIEGDVVTLRHLYVERRVRPLDLFLREADADRAARAVVDFGQAIRDLAASNIFPGDMLLKNFGVTRNDRVIFYDYDELCLVTDCRFRDMPVAKSNDEEMAGEAWFYVAESDVFPEELVQFTGLGENHRDLFLESHGEVGTARFWRDLQDRHESAELLDVFPYPPSKRLRGGG